MPSINGFPYPDTLISIYNQSCLKDIDLIFYRENIVDRMPVQLARNKIALDFIKSRADYLWFCDDDNPPKVDVLEYLLSHNKDVVNALVPLRSDPYRLNIFLD